MTAREFINKYFNGECTTEGMKFQFKDEEAKNLWDRIVKEWTSAEDKRILDYMQDWTKIMDAGIDLCDFTVAEMMDAIIDKELLGARQFDTAVDMMCQFWVHGEEVANWYNTTCY